MKESEFINQLQNQAAKQAILQKKRLLPRQFDFFSALIGNYPWQVLLIVSLITASWLFFK